MKKLNDFKNEEIKTSSIVGGLTDGGKWIPTSKDPYKDANGCTVTTTDSYYDANNNGSYDNGESATLCTSISCP